MKVRLMISRATSFGVQHPGDVIDVPRVEADLLVAAHQAEYVDNGGLADVECAKLAPPRARRSRTCTIT